MEKPRTRARPSTRGPLAGLLVLELGQIYNGPYCGLLLAHLGADVVKVEPLGGEPTRWRSASREAYPFLMLNAGKRGIAIDLKTEPGRDLFLSLAQTADVVIENFAYGVMERLGLGFDVLHSVNERLILGSSSGFGRSGPDRELPAMDLTVQAMTGVMSVTGFPDSPPVKAGVAVADFMGGVHLCLGILAALLERGRTGSGQLVEVSMQDAVIPTLASNLGGLFEGTLPPRERNGNRHGGMAMSPYNVYGCSDGWVAVFCVTDAHWQSLCRVLGRPDLAERGDLGTTPLRVGHMDEVDAAVDGWTRSRAAKEVARLLREASIPSAEVRQLKQVVGDGQVRFRGMLPSHTHPTMGKVRYFGSPIRMGNASPRRLGPAPLLGQHTRSVLSSRLGLEGPQLDELEAGGIIGKCTTGRDPADP